MEDHEFCDHCPGCRPSLVDAITGKVLSPGHPWMQAAMRVWNKATTYDQRKAFIEVTLHNSQKPEDLLLCQGVMNRITAEMTSPEYKLP